MIIFGSDRIGENGKATGGRKGDQPGWECCEQEAYWHKNGWTGYRAKDANVANAIAFTMICACRSDNVGYNQNERYLIFFTGINQPTNADCSTLVPFCVRNAGIDVDVNGIWTGNLGERLLATGAFDRFQVNDLNALCTGDILVDGKGSSHTVVVTEGRSRDGVGNVFDVPEPTLSFGSKGNEVRKLQAFFEEYGSGCKIDGDYGLETTKRVCDFQRLFGLKVDGIYGKNTHDLLVFFLWAKGVQTI